MLNNPAVRGREKASTGGAIRDGISSPLAVFTDAQPRTDLRQIQRSAQEKRGSRFSTTPPGMIAHRPARKTSLQDIQTRGRQESIIPRRLDSLSPRFKHGLDNSGEIMIGMALGNPSTAHLQPYGHLEALRSPLSASQPAPDTFDRFDPPESVEEEEFVQQRGRWKSLGSLFSRRRGSVPVDTTARDCSARQTHHVGGPRLRKSDAATEKSRNKQWTRERSISRRRAAPKRSQTMPCDNLHARSPAPPLKDAMDDFRVTDWRGGKPMMLQVDIPDVKMERYSVMFGQVLQPGRPTLMARRQADLENLKTVQEKTAEPPRETMEVAPLRIASRSVMHSPTRSSSFSLFPASAQTVKKAGLQRAATSPALHSPSRQTFQPAHLPTKDRSNTVGSANTSHSSTTSPSSHGASLSSGLSPTSTVGSAVDSDPDGEQAPVESSRFKLGNPLSSSRRPSASKEAKSPRTPSHRGLLNVIWPTESPVTPTFPTQPSIFQPSISAPVNGGRAYQDRGDATFKNRSAPRPRPAEMTTLAEKSNEDESPRATLPIPIDRVGRANPLSSSPATAAEISIARQMSVSRRQKQSLVPIAHRTVRAPKAVLVDPSAAALTSVRQVLHTPPLG